MPNRHSAIMDSTGGLGQRRSFMPSCEAVKPSRS
jgi:hypothetical protein